MNDREILRQRMTTLGSLLEAPGGPLGTSGSTLGAQLKARWSQEHKLIERILEETAQGVAVNHTLRLWQRRTQAFLKSSTSEQPSWKDRQGLVWPADVVLELLADLEDRLSSWGPDGPISAADPAEEAQESGDSAQLSPSGAKAASPDAAS